MTPALLVVCCMQSNMPNELTDSKTWWGEEGEYHIGEAPSPYITEGGMNFLSQYINENDKLVDFGVWSGRNLEPLIKLKKEVFATDVIEARSAVSMAKQRFPQVKFFETALNSLPFENNSIGGGICWRVLHNLIGTAEVINSLKEINRVLVPNAPLLVAVRTEEENSDAGFFKRIYSRVKQKPNGAGGFRKDIYFTKKSFNLLATLMGFEVIFMTKIWEKESINGQEVSNHYLVAHLLKKKNTMDRAWISMVQQQIIRLE